MRVPIYRGYAYYGMTWHIIDRVVYQKAGTDTLVGRNFSIKKSIWIGRTSENRRFDIFQVVTFT